MGLGDFLRKQMEKPGPAGGSLPCSFRAFHVAMDREQGVLVGGHSGFLRGEAELEPWLSAPCLLWHQLTVLTTCPRLWGELIMPFLGVGEVMEGSGPLTFWLISG